MNASQRPATTTDDTEILHLLSPMPASARIDGPPAPATAEVHRAESPRSGAWQSLADLDPGSLGPEGYALRVVVRDRPGILIAAGGDAGLRHAEATLAALRARFPGGIPQLSIRDEPALAWRGTIEGFYGPPWSHEARLEHLRFCAANKFNDYAYAPKDDPYHRAKWREPYPDADLARLRDLVAEASRLGVRFTYTIAPGLSMTYSSAAERELLFAKAEQLWSIGVRSFALLFDDIPTALQHQDDIERWGPGERASGVAHGQLCAQFQERFLAPRGGERLIMVPTDYAGVQASEYRTGLSETLPADALVWWTGSDIVVGQVTREDIDAAAAAFGRDLLLWDNFPVNDFDFPRVFLGPLLGRTTDLAGSRLVGVNANPMIHPTASQLSLVTVADWAWNPAAYSPKRSTERALHIVAGSLASAIRPLVAVTSAWPPSAERSPAMARDTAAALAGDRAALERLDAALAGLAAMPGALSGSEDPLVRELRPWIEAAAREAELARRATAALADGGTREEHRESIERDLEALDSHEPNVLRALLTDFVRSVYGIDSSAG